MIEYLPLFFLFSVPSQPRKLTVIPPSASQKLEENFSAEHSSRTYFTSSSLMKRLFPTSTESLMTKTKRLETGFVNAFDNRRLILTWNEPRKPNSKINRYRIMFYKSDEANRTQFMSTVSINWKTHKSDFNFSPETSGLEETCTRFEIQICTKSPNKNRQNFCILITTSLDEIRAGYILHRFSL